jgi:hypothetical protein
MRYIIIHVSIFLEVLISIFFSAAEAVKGRPVRKEEEEEEEEEEKEKRKKERSTLVIP